MSNKRLKLFFVSLGILILVLSASFFLIYWRQKQIRSSISSTDSSPTNQINEWPLKYIDNLDFYGFYCYTNNFRYQEKLLTSDLYAKYYGDCQYLDANNKTQTITIPLAYQRFDEERQVYNNFIYGLQPFESFDPIGQAYIESHLFGYLELYENKKIFIVVGEPTNKNEGVSSRDYLESFLNHKKKNIENFAKSGNPKYLPNPYIPIHLLIKNP